MPVVRMRRSTRGFKVLRSGKRVWTDQLVEVGKKQPRKRARAKDKKVSAEKSVEEAPVLKDNEKVDDGFDMSREKIEMDVDEDTRKDSVKGREKPRGAVYVRKDKMGTVESPVSSTFGSFGVHKRRSLRLRKGRICSPLVAGNADGALPGDSSIGPDVFPCSSVESGQQAISSLVDNSITSVRKRKHSLPGLIENIDTSTCCTNILVIESDRCYRVEGAAFNLVKSDANQWFVAIEKDGTRRYDVIVQQVMRTCSFNRITHAVIWTCDNGWRLEFPNRRDWLIFKELYKELLPTEGNSYFSGSYSWQEKVMYSTSYQKWKRPAKNFFIKYSCRISKSKAPLRRFNANRITCSSSSMDSSPPGYRRNVGICLINSDNKGGIDESENPRDAAIRELREETGVTSAEIIAEVPHWLTYDFPPDVREKLNRQWGSDWKGQAQKWFLFRFTGKDAEINLLGDGTEKPEFGEWSWLSPEQVLDRAVEFKKSVYKEVLEVFSSHLNSNL
uniref:Nudix hydrolase domain-containing protein n=1 Tax=Daucus carota subsp. sativus TaxID=79200 RepID=A0A164ZDN2_DAUCS